jgi:hypothetical protein
MDENELMQGLEEKTTNKIGKKLISIIIDDFPTHIAVSDNKIKANKFIKLNGQNIYNDNLNRFKRAHAMNHLHNYIMSILPKTEVPIYRKVKIKYDFFTVINHGDIRRMKSGFLTWLEAKDNYEPDWDIENLASIWIKAINDCLQKAKIIKNDNVKYVTGVSYDFHEIQSYQQRKIVVTIYEDLC